VKCNRYKTKKAAIVRHLLNTASHGMDDLGIQGDFSFAE
jgi:hypothetical protein